MNRPFNAKPWMFWVAALATGLLLAAAWPARGFTPLVFLAWVPLLWAEDEVYRHRSCGGTGFRPVFLYAFTAFLVWNILTTYWIWNSTPAAAMAWVANALIMATVFWLYHLTTRRWPSAGVRSVVLIVYWLAFEYIHHIWDIAWPWLTLGNVFATQPAWVQWYEYTGVEGGSVWVLAVNMLFLSWCKAVLAGASKREKNIKAVAVCLAILIPVGASMWRYFHYENQGRRVETVVVQPNIDPYGEQYDIPPVEAVQRMLFLSEYALGEQTRFVVTPESMIQEYVWEDALTYSPSILEIHRFLADYPNLAVVAGISTYSKLSKEDSATRGVRKRPDLYNGGTLYYLANNTVMVIDSSKAVMRGEKPFTYRHKSKLTPGVEIMPFVDKIGFLEKWAIDLGGIVGTLGIDPQPKVFRSIWPNDTVCYADIICYESIFGDYVTGFCRLGAELLFISTNDGWWGNTPGHRQHAEYARLRAIENRRDIARSANTGISGFITQRGDFCQKTDYWTPAVIKQDLQANRNHTFFSRYGDVLGRACCFFAPLLLLGGLVLRFIKRVKTV